MLSLHARLEFTPSATVFCTWQERWKGLRPVFFVPCTLWRTWGTRPDSPHPQRRCLPNRGLGVGLVLRLSQLFVDGSVLHGLPSKILRGEDCRGVAWPFNLKTRVVPQNGTFMLRG